MQTYTLTPPAPVTGARIRHLVIRPSDVADADFAIESVRLVFRREHLAEAVGRGRQELEGEPQRSGGGTGP